MLNDFYRERGKFYSEKMRLTQYLNSRGFNFTDVIQNLNNSRKVWVFDYSPELKKAVNDYREHTRKYLNDISNH